MSEVRVPEHHCLNCDATLNGVGDPAGRDTPTPGHLVVCIHCGAVMALADDLTCRPLTQQEVADIKADPDLQSQLGQLVNSIYYVNEPRQ